MGRTKSGFSAKIKKTLLMSVKVAAKVGNRAMNAEEKIPKKVKVLFLLAIVFGSIFLAVVFLRDKNMGILSPQGIIADKQRHLLTITALLSLVVVIPVYLMAFFITLKYRESNESANYRPDWDHDKTAETVWWTVPIILIFILSIITWQSSHELDPFRSLESNKKPLTIKVIALDWKWLFIYPDQNIASVNYVQFPVDTPINFEITSDAPMNSFWIPQLGGQVYAMSGMTTKLHLMASKQGDYAGSSSNISGKGFAGMKFNAHAGSLSEFIEWSINTSDKSVSLDNSAYNVLAKPSENNPVSYYKLTDFNIFDSVIHKYSMPMSEIDSMNMGIR